MANPAAVIPNHTNPLNALLIVNLSNITKLTSTNYTTSWLPQMHSTLIGLDLYGHVDGSSPPPPATITSETGVVTQNPSFLTWLLQDKLLLGSLLGTLSPTISSLVCHSSTSRQAQSIKTCTDQLAILNKPLDTEDITGKVLDGLDYESYTPLIDSGRGRDTSITFEELHEKLLRFECTYKPTSAPLLTLPASANASQSCYPRPFVPLPSYSSPASSSFPTNTPKPFLGKCQWCRVQGHSVAQCQDFKRQYPQISLPSPLPQNPKPRAPNHYPHPNVAQVFADSSSTWLLDSEASHQITNDLSNLALHASYNGTDELIIGDGSSLPITHIGSFIIYTPHRALHFNKVFLLSLKTSSLFLPLS